MAAAPSPETESVATRKQSASDLQSRLKTRKLLGVGKLIGCDNGNIYRSKILGVNENLYVSLPRGLFLWHSLNALYFYTAGILCVALPSIGAILELPPPTDAGSANEDTDLVRLYGVVLLAYALLLRGQLLVRDSRSEIASLLSACALLFSLQLCVNVFAGRLSRWTIMVRAVGIAGNLVYQSLLDSQGGLLRIFHRHLLDFRYSFSSSRTVVSNSDKEKST